MLPDNRQARDNSHRFSLECFTHMPHCTLCGIQGIDSFASHCGENRYNEPRPLFFCHEGQCFRLLCIGCGARRDWCIDHQRPYNFARWQGGWGNRHWGVALAAQATFTPAPLATPTQVYELPLPQPHAFTTIAAINHETPSYRRHSW